MHSHLRKLAATQEDIVAAWQLLKRGWTRAMVIHHLRRGWRRIHTGVYALNHAPLSQRQLWIAATLTAPGTFPSHGSAGAGWGFRPLAGSFETVTRPGRGGPRRHGRLLVCRSSVLAGDVTRHQGIPITTAARTLLDLAPHIGDTATRRAFRESIRLKRTTAAELKQTVDRHPRRPGSPLLGDLATRYAALPYHRARSDAECLALEVFHDADGSSPLLNRKIAGEEADLVWPDRKLIIELDGPQFHRFPEEDARKQRLWERAGFAVRRLSTDDVYDQPGRLVALSGHA